MRRKDTDWFKQAKIETAHLKKTGIPRCMTCKVNFKKIDKYQWTPKCKCITGKFIISLG